MPKISTIITSYNVEHYIATAIQSVLDAGLEESEILVVDDGSTDKTCDIIMALRDMYADRVNIRPVLLSRNTIGGVAIAANIGMDMARGEYVIFVDGDDWVIPRHLRHALDLLDQGGHDFVVTDCAEFWNGTNEYTKYPEAAQWEALDWERDPETQRQILLEMAPFPWRKLYRRSFLNDLSIRFPVGDYMFEDNPFHWETTVRARSFAFLRKETHIHRMARVGQTVDSKGVKFLKILDHYDTIRAMLQRNGQFEARKEQLLGWLLRHVIWCAERVPPAYLNEVYDKTRAKLEAYSDDMIRAQLIAGDFEAKGVRCLMAIHLGERFEFLREF